MVVIIAGCGRVGSGLAYQLYREDNTVTVIDQDELAFDNLPPDFHGRVIEGDVLDLKVLQRANIEKADAFVAATNSDSVNAVAGHLASTVFHVPKVVIRNLEPRLKIVHDTFGLQSVGTASWGVQRIEELLYSDPLQVVFSDLETEVRIFKYAVAEKWQGRLLRELLPEKRFQAIAVSRAGKVHLPDPSMVMAAGDELFIQASLKDAEALRVHLDSQREM